MGGDYHCPMATLLRRGVGKLTAMRSAMRKLTDSEGLCGFLTYRESAHLLNDSD